MRFEIPYRVVGGIRFYQRKEIKDILAYLRLIANPADRVSLERVVNLPPRGIGAKTLLKYFSSHPEFISGSDGIPKQVRDDKFLQKICRFLEMMADIREKSKAYMLTDLVDYIAEKTGYRDFILDGTPEGEGRWENILELKSVISYTDALNLENPLEAFLEKVALYQDADDYDAGADVVTLMTLHSAKGLEFPVVFIIGFEEGLLPHSRSINEDGDIEEERRLCYVGITRARKKLYLIYASQRIFFGNPTINLPSRFLEEIPEEVRREI